jgi:hypothetical protein
MSTLKAILTISFLFVSPLTWACFPSPDAKPSNEVSELALPARPQEPAVVYTVKKYAIYIKPQDLLSSLKPDHASISSPGDLYKILQSKLPLVADLSTNALAAPLAPRMPGATDEPRSEVGLADRNFWAQADGKFGYVIAELLEAGKATVVDLSTGEALPGMTRHKYSEICSGGRRFLSPSGELILRTMDWIS